MDALIASAVIVGGCFIIWAIGELIEIATGIDIFPPGQIPHP